MMYSTAPCCLVEMGLMVSYPPLAALPAALARLY
jgi:hypothetical protein